MKRNAFETLIGAVVLMVAAGFLMFAYKNTGMTGVNGYSLIAKFDRADGLSLGSDVRVSGLKVGTVTQEKIDPKTYLAIITMDIDDAIKIPKDSSAEIVSDGLLGGKYIALVPGGAEKMLKNNDQIQFTQSSVNIESLIGKFMFGSADDGNGSKEKDEEDTFDL